jgi:hypothetical protein
MQDMGLFTGKQRYMLFILRLVYACHLIDRTIVLVLLDPIRYERTAVSIVHIGSPWAH